MSIHHFTTRRAIPVAGLLAGVMIASSAQAGTPVLDTVVYQGLANSPPGFPGLFWNLSSGYSNPVIDNSGKIAFVGTIFGDGIIATNNRVMWYGDDTNWSIVARASNPTPPGLPGLTLSNLSTNSPALAPNGSLVLSATVAGSGVTTSTDTAFWSGPAASLGLVARESTTVAPGADAAVLSSGFGGLSMANSIIANNAGQVFFASNLSGGTPAVTTTNNFGTYVGSPSGVVEVCRKGVTAGPDGSTITPDGFGFRMNGAGEVAHTGTLVGGTVTTASDKVLYTTVGGPLRIVAREGSAAPGGGSYGSSFTIPVMMVTNGGKILFNSTVSTVSTWYLDDHGSVTRVIGVGDSIAGESLAAVFSGGMFLNNNDRLLIVANSTAGTNPSRIWTGPVGGPFVKVVEQGVTTVPGHPDIILNFSGSSANAAFNSAGQCVFTSNLTGNVIAGQDDTGLFAWDPTAGLVLVARTGPGVIPELLDVASLSLIGGTGITGENGSPILTDNGWLTFRAQDVKGFQAIMRTHLFVPDCPADVNGDHTVGVADLLAVISAWGACPNPNNCPADLNNDDVVGVADLLTVISAWGACP